MRGVGVAQAMGGNGLVGVYLAPVLFYHPLYPGGGNGPWYPIVGYLAVEKEGSKKVRTCFHPIFVPKIL
jgi:hypothetical protein